MTDNWSKTGWFGIVVDTPPDWNLGAISGNEGEGYYRVDSPDGATVEIRWRTRKGGVNLESILDEYFRGLTKTSKKTKVPLETGKKPKALQGIRPAGRMPVTFSWTGDRKAVGAVWACGTCDRVVIAQVVWPLESGMPQVARILGSIVDHPEKGLATWALYDLEVQVPEDFKIATQKLMSGYIRLDFARKSSKLVVERWGLAGIALKEATISQWVRDKSEKLIREYRFEESDFTSHGHRGALFEGPIRGPVRVIKALVQGLLRLKPASRLTLVAWDCPEANRIFAVSFAGPRDEDLGRQVAESIICHSGK